MDAGSSPLTPSPSRLRRGLLLVAGSISLGLGMVGIAVPVLPTTPFLILAAICYARSSERCYRWLVTNRVFGRHLYDYLHGRGVSWKVKAGALVFLWAVIGCTVVLAVHALWLRIVLLAIAAAVTAHVLALKGRPRSGA